MRSHDFGVRPPNLSSPQVRNVSPRTMIAFVARRERLDLALIVIDDLEHKRRDESELHAELLFVVKL